MPNGDYLDDTYIEEIKKAGTLPSEVNVISNNPALLDLFREYVANEKDNLDVYAGAIQSLIVEGKNPEVVWSEVENNWSGSDDDLKELLEPDALKTDLLNDAYTQLKDPYKDFLNQVSQIRAGTFDSDLDINEMDEEELENELDILLSQVATKLDEKTNDEIDKLLDFLEIDQYSVNEDELEADIRKLKELDSNDKGAINRIRSSSRIDLNDLQKLLNDLNDDDLIFEDDEFASRINELAEVKQDLPKEQILNLIDVNELEADEQEIDNLFDLLEEYINADKKNVELKKLRRSTGIDPSDLDRLIEELNSPIAPDYSDQLDELINLLAEEVPGGVLTKNSVTNLLPKELVKNDYDVFIENIVNLQNDDKPYIRRRLSTIVPKDDLDHLLEQLLSDDEDDEQPVPGRNQPQAPTRPQALKISQWNVGNVNGGNYAVLKDAKPDVTLNVLVCGDYVLIGDDWGLEYTNGFDKSYQGDKEYPAGQGLVEVGKAQVEKGSGLFNQGTVRIRNVTSGRNRAGITASITAKSKKKVVFLD